MCTQLLQSCLTLHDTMDYSPPGYSIHGIFMASILELVAKPCSRGSSWSKDQTHVSCIAGRFFITEPLGKPMSLLARQLSHFSHVRLFVILWTVVHQAPLSHRILQARILEQFALPSSRRSSPPRDGNCLFLKSPALASKLLTNSATWEVLPSLELPPKDQLC